MQRVHIVGPPRSGTTLMLELMVNGFAFDGWAAEERSLLLPPPRGAALYCAKHPADHRHAKLMLRLDPALWLIAMICDPRDAAVSRHGLRPDRYWATLRQWNAAYRNLRPLLAHPRLLPVRYEDLVRDPDAVQRAIAARMPFLPLRRPFSRYPEAAAPSAQSLRALGGLRPVEAASIGAWRRHRPRLKGQMLRHGDPTPFLIELGYEPDGSWRRALEGIEPDLAPGYWPDRPRLARTLHRRGRDLLRLARMALHLATRG